MAYVAGHLSVAALEERYEACEDVMSSRHFQAIWLLAKGHSTGEVASMTSFGQRWIEQLVERYNALGPSAMGDLRRGNGAPAKVLTAELLQRLRLRLGEPPPDGGVWTSGKVARWMAGELGLASLAPQRLGGVAGDRLVDPEAATAQPESGDARRARSFQKKLAEVVAEEAARHPDTPIEAFATDEHRLGLKPVSRRVWAPVGERPIAHGHHRFEWLYVTAFVSPATGESFWYVSNGVSKPFFEALLRLFAEEAGAGRERRIVLTLDNAGWHSEAGLAVPDGVRLVFQPAYTPEVQPAETLWTLVDEPVVNKHIPTLEALDEIISMRCAALAKEPAKIKSQAGFHWWPKIANPK
jgi:transposase